MRAQPREKAAKQKIKSNLLPSKTRLIVGLGNPGPKYECTRHNFGFLLLDALDDKLDECEWKLESKQVIPELGRLKVRSKKDREVRLLWPLTFMNLSGIAVEKVLETIENENFSVQEDLLVLMDDLSLDMGRCRIRPKGSSGGHNGLKSIEGHLGHFEYPRLKLGIGRPSGEQAVVDYVLENFSPEETSTVVKVNDFLTAELLHWSEGKTPAELAPSINSWRQLTIEEKPESESALAE